MVQTPASLIQNILSDTFETNTGDGWVRFGERVISALAQSGLYVLPSSAPDASVQAEPRTQESYGPENGGSTSLLPGDTRKCTPESNQDKDHSDPIDELIEICRKNAEEDLGMQAIEALRRAGFSVARNFSGGRFFQAITSADGTSKSANYSDGMDAGAELVRLIVLIQAGNDLHDAWFVSRRIRRKQHWQA